MRVITSSKLGIYAFQKFNGWLIIRVLWHKFSVNGKVKYLGLYLAYGYCYINRSFINYINCLK